MNTFEQSIMPLHWSKTRSASTTKFCAVSSAQRLLRRSRIVFLFFLSLRTVAWAQSPPPPLQLEGLSNARLIQNIYLGRFERIPMFDEKHTMITPDGIALRQLLLGYVEGYSDQCKPLSPKKKQIKITVTTYEERQSWLRTKFGPLPVGSTSTPIKQETVETGVFAEPEFYDAYAAIFNSQGTDALAALLRELSSKRSDNLLGATLNLFQDQLQRSVESRVLIARHGCKSPQIQRYAQNLLAYVNGQPPVHRDETFLRNCRSEIAKLIPGARPQGCGCLQNVLQKRMDKQRYEQLEDFFSQENLLTAVISKVGLHQEVATCLK